MFIRYSRTAIVVALAVTFQPVAFAAEDEAAVVVTATRVPYREVDATYAAEVHTHRMIERSGAQSLADYLGQHSSLTVMPNYGNRLTPTLEMRGYGSETGNQNIVVSIDGQRLNAIDQQPQLLGAIPLSSIERIEIIKGSGSVMQGDGAMAGAIRIFTKPQTGITLEGRAGSHGYQSESVAAGLHGDMFSLSIGVDRDRHGGFAEPDSRGKKDNSVLRTERAKLVVNPTTALALKLDVSSAHTEVRYQNWLTLTEFGANPSQIGGRGTSYTSWASDVSRWRSGVEYAISDSLKLTADHHRLDQEVKWNGANTGTGYDTEGDDLALIYKGDKVDIVAGVQRSDASRTQTGFGANQTSKNNTGYYVQGTYRFGVNSISSGLRRERVDYTYTPAGGTRLSGMHALTAWDIGINHRFDEKYSLFANLNKSVQAPDIDRFFKTDWWTNVTSFNGFIVPAEAKTLTAGVHRVSGPGNKFKFAYFRANLNNEIYYDPVTGNNTNINKSNKQGIEVHQYWKATADISLNLNYNWTKAVIRQEDGVAGAYDGKEMPGVPRHALTAAATYAIDGKSDVTVSHAWRSKSYAISDFDNNNAQRQAAVESTSLTWRHRRESVDYFASINNLFARKNGVWAGDNTIYPVNYARSLAVGVKARF